jgi:hypothetical protein
MTARSGSNAELLDRKLRRWRKEGRLSDFGELVARLAQTTARLVDEACAPDSAVPAYARATSARAHEVALADLRQEITPEPPTGPDPWQVIADELTASVEAAESRVAPDTWDAAEETLADGGTWP